MLPHILQCVCVLFVLVKIFWLKFSWSLKEHHTHTIFVVVGPSVVLTISLVGWRYRNPCLKLCSSRLTVVGSPHFCFGCNATVCAPSVLQSPPWRSGSWPSVRVVLAILDDDDMFVSRTAVHIPISRLSSKSLFSMLPWELAWQSSIM